MIDYALIDRSISFYSSFTRIEVPWMVSQEISNLTCPSERRHDFVLSHNQKTLVASGEQSFLYLYCKEFLPLGRFQAVTPCFRNDYHDVTHRKHFIKNELIVTDDVSEDNLQKVIDLSVRFFHSEGFEELEVVQETLGSSYDILYKGTELGSYGIRTCPFLTWIYGTGVAEPRTSNLKKQYGISCNRN